MSNRIFQAVWDNGPRSRSDMLVLMVLADSADAESAECFPSLRRIADGARMSVRTARACLRSLESEGWITSTVRQRNNGSQASSVYTIQIEKLGLSPVKSRAAKTAAPPAKTAALPRQKLPPTGAAKTAPLEQTIYNKGPAALSLNDLGRYALSALMAGNPVVLANGSQIKPGEPQYAALAELLRQSESQCAASTGS